MAVRPIDANALHAEISKWPESVMYKDWVQSAIANAPTLTPPNEPLTLENCGRWEDNRIGTLGCGKKVLRHIGISWTPSVQSA